MFAIGFDLVVKDTLAYADIGSVLTQYDFERVQGSLYLTKNDDLANLFAAIMALKGLAWFPPSVRDIRAFKVEHWSDFTRFVKTSQTTS